MRYLKKHEDFLRKHETTPRKELASIFNAKFKTNVSHNALGQKCVKLGLVCPNTGVFKKGNVPTNKGTKGLMRKNKTSFKPGNKPITAKKVGAISTRKDTNGNVYMHIKISEPSKWKMLHVYIWESAYGKIPKGHCVIFKDKNTLNTSLNNLMLVSRAELVRLNQKYTHIHESLKETALQVIKISTETKNINKKD